MEERINELATGLAAVKQEVSHLKDSQILCMQKNDATHDRLERKLDESMRFQMKLRWTIGFVSTMLGAAFLILYHYLPWIWDHVPMHLHDHTN